MVCFMCPVCFLHWWEDEQSGANVSCNGLHFMLYACVLHIFFVIYYWEMFGTLSFNERVGVCFLWFEENHVQRTNKN